MKIRTQITLAFLLFAILPMTAIVLYSYVSSLRTVRQAVEAEAEILTADMESRMGQVRAEIRHRVERVGSLPLRRWALEDETELERAALYESVVAELGETAPLVERFEFVPEWVGAEPALAAPAPVPPGERPPPPPRAAPIVIDMRQMLATVEASIENLDPSSIQGTDKETLIEQARQGLELVQEHAEQLNLKTGRILEIRAETDSAAPDDVPDSPARTAADRRRAELEQQIFMTGAAVAAAAPDKSDESGTSYRLLFSQDLEVPVYEDGALVGEVRAQVKNEEVLRQVLARTRRDRGELPFAIDGEGGLHAVTDDDRDHIVAIGLVEPIDREELSERRVFDNWVVVTSPDEATGLTFGIAKPIEESLAEMRSTALRNFGVGSGLIGLALLGVLPLSRRMTHGLNLVSRGAERVAGGDLGARVPLESKNEIGQLARAFNNMAEDLQENQQRLLAGERMQAEFDRKTEELEEARRFQLSLLPKALPEHPAFDLAAVMKTATEVGGDYYDFRIADDGALTVAIGDATGHGAKAGTMVTVVKSLFSAFPPESGLAEFQAQAAAAIKRMDLGRMSMALTLARLSEAGLKISAAGMPPVLVRRAVTGSVEEISIEGMPLGGLDFAYRERSVALESGDIVLLMSDGFPELPSSEGEVLGYDRASASFAAGGTDPNGIIRHLLASAESWAEEAAPADDITFVAIRVR